MLKYYLGTIIWYIIFIFSIPIILGTEAYLCFYLPLVHLLAELFTIKSKWSKYFRGLYEYVPTTIVSFISSNFIKLVAVFGIILNGSNHIYERNNKWIGIKIMLIMYFITYLIPLHGFHRMLDKIDKYVSKYVSKYNRKYIYIYKYLIGLMILIILVLLESYIITKYLFLVDNDLGV